MWLEVPLEGQAGARSHRPCWQSKSLHFFSKSNRKLLKGIRGDLGMTCV